MTSDEQRIEVFYSGRVQGVGFRLIAVRQATDLPITGWVKNLPDGRVQLIAEGNVGNLKQLLQRIDLAMAGNIVKRSVDWQPARGSLSKFAIAY